MVDIERIRYAHFREGSRIRELARAFHHSRTTIRRALEDSGPWTYRRTRRRPAPVMDQVAPIIEAWLADALHRPQGDQNPDPGWPFRADSRGHFSDMRTRTS